MKGARARCAGSDTVNAAVGELDAHAARDWRLGAGSEKGEPFRFHSLAFTLHSSLTPSREPQPRRPPDAGRELAGWPGPAGHDYVHIHGYQVSSEPMPSDLTPPENCSAASPGVRPFARIAPVMPKRPVHASETARAVCPIVCPLKYVLIAFVNKSTRGAVRHAFSQISLNASRVLPTVHIFSGCGTD